MAPVCGGVAGRPLGENYRRSRYEGALSRQICTLIGDGS
jgi:hypothetical protein